MHVTITNSVGDALQVGLQRDWYDVTAWPPQQQQQVVKPALAAAARGKGLTVPAAELYKEAQQPHSLAASAGVAGAVPAVPKEGRQLEELRMRLWQMLEVEEAVCSR